jgi:hypothetical protein
MTNDPTVQSPEDTAKCSTKAASANTPPEEVPKAVWPGMSLSWNSPSRQVVLHGELPFWLLVPDCIIQVTVKDCTLELSVTGNAIEIQSGIGYRDSHSSTTLIDKVSGKPSERALDSMKKGRFTLRTTRTLISIKTAILGDTLLALGESGQRRVDAETYFTSFVRAHLPFVNSIVNAYRRAAADPFALEVTEWDIPVWYIDVDEKFIPIQLVPYKRSDEFPVIGSPGEQAKKITFVEASDLEKALNSPETPGEIELLDAWSLYYRGRQADAIRSLITSIEVLLEAKLREYLANAGLSEEDVELRLDQSRNNFQSRLTEYTQVSRRRVPGPILSVLPNINGVRLREELEQARKLRHKIVHEGERISFPFHGRMQRVMETMTWFFNWLSEYPPPRGRSLEGDPLKGVMRGGGLAFPYEYRSSGVVVQEFARNPGESVHVVGDLEYQLVAALENGSVDVEKFALMAVSQLGFKGFNAPPPEQTSPLFSERLILNHGNEFVPLFLHDSHEGLERNIIEQIAARLLALKVGGNPFSLALLILNAQNGLDWQLRGIEEAVTETAGQIAVACGIAVVTTVDLLLLIKGIKAGLWSVSDVSQSLMHAGQVGLVPPGFRDVGYVRTFFDRPQVASVILEGDATVRRGDFVLIRLDDHYYGQEIKSMQKDRIDIEEAKGGIIGIQLDLRRSDVTVASAVFVRDGINRRESEAPPPDHNAAPIAAILPESE